MKRLIFFYVGILLVLNLYSQNPSGNLNVESFRLGNGLTVYLNEDHSTPSVLGAVIIKTGGKYDPADATGTSHYLEHMMFKGTDIIGTINYEEEKIFLDSIALKYDELAKTTDVEERKIIQSQINELSIKAGDYAIPNELDKILDQIGSTSVNAFTSDEIVAYFNMFPKNQIERWLFIYSSRFMNPVFRLFQSELETVFEEKNMYADDMISNFIEKYYAAFYKNHPYGTQTVIGSADHIKNPSLTNMKKMYDTYYVANNMALVLTGNFEKENVKPLIEKYFGQWKGGDVPEFPEYKEEPFDGIEVVKERITPIKAGMIGFRTVPANHEDEIILEVCQALLNNNSSTGYLDKLNLEGKLLGAMCLNDVRNDHGALMILYVPKILGQSLKKAESLVYEEVEKLHSGNIDESFFESVKLGLIKGYQQSLENSVDRAFLIAQGFTQDKTWGDIMDYPEKVGKVSIDDIKRVSAKYLNNNYLSFQSRMGFPKKDKLNKPGFDPIIPKNSEEKSEFVKELDKVPELNSKPEFVNISEDLTINELNNGSKLFYVKNEINDIFNLKIKFHTGTLTNTRYDQLSEYMSLIGTQDMPLSEFNEKLQSLGCSFYVTARDNYFEINIDGFDEYLQESMTAIASLLNSPKADDTKLKIIRQGDNFSKKYEKNSADELARILTEYGIYGTESKYLTRLTKKEINNLKSGDLLALLAETIKKPYSVHYSGTVPENDVRNFVLNEFKFNTVVSSGTFPLIRERVNYAENTILLLDDPKALQSKINFYIAGKKNLPEERTVGIAFNQYFGSGMSSLVFQEIREFRSLAYSSYAVYRNGLTFDEPGYLRAFVGTQSDKTIEAISIMDSLLTDMPLKDNRMPLIKSALIQSINSGKPEWRQLSETVERWFLSGYEDDPRKIQYDIISGLNFDQIVEFYKSNVSDRPILIMIVGNKKQINMDELAKFGKIIEVKQKEIMNK